MENSETTSHSIETLAYAAGLIDAEGSICISVTHPRKYNNVKVSHHELFVSMKITHKATIEWMKDHFSGFINDHSHMPSRKGMTPIWVWRVAGPTACKFLELVYPYMHTKNKQALLAIEFYRYCQKYPGTTRANRTQEVMDRREAYRQQIHSLHLSRKEWKPNDIILISNTPTNDLAFDPVATNAYAAGFFDGEGCIYIQAMHPSGKRGNGELRHPAYCLRVQLVNTDHAIIEWLQSTFGGCIQDRSKTPSMTLNPKQRPVKLWYISSYEAQKFLILMEPFLKIKAQQARLGIDFQNENRPYMRKTPEILRRKEDFRQQISKLNLSQRALKGIEKHLDA